MPAEPPALPDWQTLLDSAPCGLVTTKEDGTILYSNQMLSDWVGVERGALIGRRFQELLTIGGRIFHQTHWAPLMRMQGSVAEVKLDLMQQDRRVITVLLNGVRREYPTGVIYELALFSIIDRDKYERELLSSRKTAENLLREKVEIEAALRLAQAELNDAYEGAQRRASFAEQMVTIVSHDLKNPLTVIRLASDALNRGERNAKEAKLLHHITHSAHRAERMIVDLLDLALVRAGKGIALSRSSTDLHRLVLHSVEELRVTYPHVTLNHESAGVGHAYLDGDRVQQVIGNLVSNAVAYGDLQQPVTVASLIGDDEMVVSVNNFGEVIAAESMAALFEPMNRGTDVEIGARSVGLGLFIVREIARAHGGRVAVTSDRATGTTFSIHIPAAQYPVA